MKKLDKLRNKVKVKINNNKKMILLVTILFLIGFIAGTIFITIIAKGDHEYIKEYMNNYINNIKNNNLNYLTCFKDSVISNMLLFIFIFLLGISVIGIPLIIFIYFFKCFIFGFTISSFILTFKIKGILFTIIYLIPNLLILTLLSLLSIYAVKVSMYLIYSIFNKLEINFKDIMNHYFKILIFSIVGIIIYSLLETFMTPHFISIFI